MDSMEPSGVKLPIPVTAWSKAWDWGRLLAGIVGSNPAGGMECCVLSGRSLCFKLITRPDESYRVSRVRVWSWSLENETRGCCAMKKIGVKIRPILSWTASSLLRNVAYGLNKVCFLSRMSRFHGTPINGISLHPQEKYGLPWADFHETHKRSIILCTDITYQISPISNNKCGK
jgi:hypothetical protein